MTALAQRITFQDSKHIDRSFLTNDHNLQCIHACMVLENLFDKQFP